MELRRHQSPKVEVYWSVHEGCAYEVRPLPDKAISGRFISCRFLPHCNKGKNCTYAHNEIECAIWNERKQSRSGTLVRCSTIIYLTLDDVQL